MSEISDELHDGLAQPIQRIWSGIVANNPTDLSTLVEVTIPAMDSSQRWTKCFWQSRNATDVPHRGDPCLIIFDDNMQPWVVAWWPY